MQEVHSSVNHNNNGISGTTEQAIQQVAEQENNMALAAQFEDEDESDNGGDESDPGSECDWKDESDFDEAEAAAEAAAKAAAKAAEKAKKREKAKFKQKQQTTAKKNERETLRRLASKVEKQFQDDKNGLGKDLDWLFGNVECEDRQPQSNVKKVPAPRKNLPRTARKNNQQYKKVYDQERHHQVYKKKRHQDYKKERHQPDWPYLDPIQFPQKDTGDGKHTISSTEFENWCKGEVDPKAPKHNRVGAGAQHQKDMTDVVSWDDDGKFRFTSKVGPLDLFKLIWCIVPSRKAPSKDRRYALKDILVRMTAFLEEGLECPRKHWELGVKLTPPMIRLIDVALKVIRISTTKGANGEEINLPKEYRNVCKRWEICLGRSLQSINTVWAKKDGDYETQDRETGKFIKFEFNQTLSDFF